MNNQPGLDDDALRKSWYAMVTQEMQLANERNVREDIQRANQLQEEIRQLCNPLNNPVRGNVQDLIDDRQLELDKMVPVINLSIMVKTWVMALNSRPFMATPDDEWDPDVIFDLYDPSLGSRPIGIRCSQLKDRILRQITGVDDM
ncbi:MAG: hypothetical protein ACRCZI_14185 [Cetobacterium sp.]